MDKLINKEPPNIAITRTMGGIGDVLMTLPTVKAISKKYGVKVTYGTDFNYLDGALPRVLQHNPYISEIVRFQEIEIDNFTAVIDLTCPCVVHEQPLAPPINRIDLFARHVRIPLEDHNIDLVITDKEKEDARLWIQQNGLAGKKLIMVNATSSTSVRDAPRDKQIKSLIGLLKEDKNIRIVLVTHGSDHTKTEWRYSEVIQFHNKNTREIAALMGFTELVMCPDSAILHVAAALHHKTFTLFGPTDPRARINHHPEAVAIWPTYNHKNYPSWYKDPGDGYVCWKKLNVDLMTKTMSAMINNLPIPNTGELITFGFYQREQDQFPSWLR